MQNFHHLTRINQPWNSVAASAFARCSVARLRLMRIICCWTNPPTISTGRDVSGSTTSSPVIRGVLVASHDRELLAKVPRILELSASGLRHYGGSYDDYTHQRDAEQQAARAALEHAATERKRTRARMQKSMTKASGVRRRRYVRSITLISPRSSGSNTKWPPKSALAHGKTAWRST